MLINILLFIIGYLILFKMYSKNFLFLIIGLFQIIFLSLWAHLSTFFIDSQNGIYAIELMKVIDVQNSSSFRMLFFITFLMGAILFFSKSRRANLKKLYQKNDIINYKFLSIGIETIVKIIFSFFLLLVLLDILSKPIPLFSEVGKGEYYLNYASSLVKYFYTYATFISFFIGFFILNIFRKEGKIDYHYLFLFFLILILFLFLSADIVLMALSSIL